MPTACPPVNRDSAESGKACTRALWRIPVRGYSLCRSKVFAMVRFSILSAGGIA
jgi:hypothetical protein